MLQINVTLYDRKRRIKVIYKCNKTKEEIINIIAKEFEEAHENYNKAMNQKDMLSWKIQWIITQFKIMKKDITNQIFNKINFKERKRHGRLY